MTRIRPSVTRHGTTSGQWILRSCMFSDIQPSRKGGLSVAAFPRFVQNAGHGSRAPVYVRGRRPPPVTRKPGDLSHGHAPQPHEKTAAATGVLHDRPQSTVCCRCQTEAPWPPECPGTATSLGSYQHIARVQASKARVGRSLPLGRREIREQSPSRQLRLSATDASYRSGWKQMQPAVDCGLRVVDHKLWIATGKVKIISLTSTLWRRAEHRPVNLMEPFSFHQAHWPRLCGSRWRAGVANEFHHKSDQPS